MLRKGFSVVIVPEDTGKIIKKWVSRRKVISVLSALSLFSILFLVFTVGYFKVKVDHRRLGELTRENARLEAKIRSLQSSVETIKGQLSEVVRTDENIRLIFDLPSIHPAIREVGIGGPSFGSMEIETPLNKTLSVLEHDVDKILRQMELENASFSDVHEKLLDRKDILDQTPSIIPVEGFVTSGLGLRRDPFTGMVTMHEGIDISAPRGTPVIAPASGTVVECGWERGMGNYIIIDHGNSLKSYYGHLNLLKVRQGQSVDRFDVIGLVGSSGRSTGPHLHYEIKKYGRVVNPAEFFVRSIIFGS